MRGLYAIVDVDFLEGRAVPILLFAERVLEARPALLQLRAKSASPRDALALLRALRPLCTRYGVQLFANDRPDLALLAHCDGVHVGQDDPPPAEVRRFAPGLRVGVSTHGTRQLAEALAAAPDYVAFGPVFATDSKGEPDPMVGLQGLAKASRLVRQGSGAPLVAIGGLDLGRAGQVAPHAALGAVIGALWPPEGLSGVTARARALHEAFGGR